MLTCDVQLDHVAANFGCDQSIVRGADDALVDAHIVKLHGIDLQVPAVLPVQKLDAPACLERLAVLRPRKLHTGSGIAGNLAKERRGRGHLHREESAELPGDGGGFFKIGKKD